ncbi:hypothetical protein RhiirC2_781008 [Rhizophagus irregularis]|uniref:Uncharacterized protein n=1 Tax=Rhizophagus irregularis TaxID=588596 RepID=A0A2N1N686_9GLOM|nr:hypothetical protein RhiirC2_781008 [Rhizophagus irregularis]
MIKSAASTRSLRSQSVTLELDKRKFEDNQFESTSNKKIKPIEDENNDYATKELDLDIDMNPKQFNDEYITTEVNFDI